MEYQFYLHLIMNKLKIVIVEADVPADVVEL